jgi:hypothetical protein
VTFKFFELKELFIVDGLKVSVSVSLYLVIIALINLHGLFNDLNLFDSKFNTTKFDDVTSLHNIVDLVIIVLETMKMMSIR